MHDLLLAHEGRCSGRTMETAGAGRDTSVARFQALLATQRQLSTERDNLRLLLDVTNAIVSKLDLPELVDGISSSLERAIPHEFTALALYEKDSGDLVVHAVADKSGDGQRYVGKRFIGSAARATARPLFARRW